MNVVEELLGRGGDDRRLALIDACRRSDGGAPAPGAQTGDAAGTTSVSYAQLASLVDDAAQRLRAAGVLPAPDGVARIGIAAPNGIPHVVLALAVLRAGGCVVPVAGELAPPERQALLRAVHPRAVLVADAPWDAARDGAVIATIEVAGTTVRIATTPGGEGKARSPHDEEALARLDPAFVRFSSGTTGDSKGVILSHRTLVDRIAAANRGLGITANDRILWLLPMAHHFAASILLYLAQRATTVLLGARLASDVLSGARRYGATVFYGSPFHHALLAAEGSGLTWPHLRLAVSTAAALPVATARAFEQRFDVPVAQVLGIIEAGLVAINHEPRTKPESVGRPLPDFVVELRDERGGRVTPGEVGELFLRGPGMLDAYLWPFRRRAEILADGWFGSGDLATADAHGSLRLVGRSRSVINVSGMKCFPEEIEAVLQAHPEVAAARVSGRPHPHVGAVPVADVVPRDPAAPPTSRALSAHCRAALARYKVPVEFRVVTALPLTASGKVKR
jgi:long-chain acyl-CoA synthetase